MSQSLKDLYIMGTGGFAREIAWLVEDINRHAPSWNLRGYIDEMRLDAVGQLFYGYPLLGGYKYLETASPGSIVIAIGNGKIRKKIVEELAGKYPFATLIHPTVLQSSTVVFGDGCMICAGNIFTTDVHVGKHVIVNLTCTVGHGAILNDYCTVLPGTNLSGEVKIGECSTIGTGCAIIENVVIGNHTMIGAGAVVVKDIPPHCTAVGCPAKPIKTSEASHGNT